MPPLAAWAGIAGPIGFLGVAFLLSALRHDVIETAGWASWPSSMALGGVAGVPMTAAFCWLAASYTVFAMGALRPVLVHRGAWAGFLAIAVGDVLLGFPTDGPGRGTTWHGALHLTGVLAVTAATLVAAAGVTIATAGRPAWRAWRATLPIPFAAAAVGAAAGFDTGWGKVVYVVGITLPAAVVAACILREEPASAQPGLDDDL
jgi:hypothetical protein